MASVKTKITVTLTDENIKEAVAAWLNAQFTIGEIAYWEPADVSVDTRMEWRGTGTHESQVPIVEITAKK